jgi:hypothetical protein
MVVELATPLHTRIKVKAAKQRIHLRRLMIMLLEQWLQEDEQPVVENPLHMPEPQKEVKPIRLVNEIRQ